MEKLLLSKKKLPDFIKEIQKTYRVIAPVKNDDIVSFKDITKPSEITTDYLNSQVPPKDILFQQTETMFTFDLGKKGTIAPKDIDTKKTVIFGIRPCDAKNFKILDYVFKDDDFEDPYYLTKRDNTILVGMGCVHPGVNCFCTSLGDGPISTQHMDVLLTDIGDQYYVEIQTGKGEHLIKALPKLFTSAAEKDAKKKKDIEKKATGEITRYMKTENIAEKLETLFENKLWKMISLKCLGCGTCTYLCPTCHCFDIQDEATLTQGARIRVWDTCMSPEYTIHASGHNPRPERMNRMRNRVYHKYNYYPKNYDEIACVGCGRCITNCPVNIDIIEIINTAQEVKK
jgi:ferredoxin